MRFKWDAVYLKIARCNLSDLAKPFNTKKRIYNMISSNVLELKSINF